MCSTGNVDLVRSLGADHVVDYTREDFTRSGRHHDLLLDVAGSRPWSACRRVLSRDATLVLVGGPKTNPWTGPLGHVAGARRARLPRRRTRAGKGGHHRVSGAGAPRRGDLVGPGGVG